MSPTLVRSLVTILEAKDISTAAHTWRVVLYTRALAERFTDDHQFLQRLTYGAALHDVGKIEIPDVVLLKPGKLTADEFEIIKQHPTLGWERLRRFNEADPLVLNLVRHHHERWDGAGYPDRLAGDAIPPAARYFAVVDAFDAMTSIRPYRKEVGPEAADKAIDELMSNRGIRYQADAVDAFVQLYRSGQLGWILEYFNDRCPMPDYEALDNCSKVRPSKPPLNAPDSPKPE